ncbi:MAG TPA: creatininase family protein [Planctomycetota bacterium]|nr:creatininase family protein [Planctomycetota bacterium]
MQFLRPGQIRDRLKQFPVVYIPFGPLEWHGPHLPYGMDPLNAENVAGCACERTGGVVWPTQYWGTERDRRPETNKSLGFPVDQYVVGMDFPAHFLPSLYCPEEVFGILLRDLLRQVITLGAKAAILVNGHGAENHIAVFRRLEREFNATSSLKVLFRYALMGVEGGEHAGVMETSILMNIRPDAVDLGQLPKKGPLKYTQFGIVDAGGFLGMPGPGHALPPREDPRRHASPALGKKLTDKTVDILVRDVYALMKAKKAVRTKKSTVRPRRLVNRRRS